MCNLNLYRNFRLGLELELDLAYVKVISSGFILTKVWFGRRNRVGNIQNEISGRVHFRPGAGVWASNFTGNF